MDERREIEALLADMVEEPISRDELLRRGGLAAAALAAAGALPASAFGASEVKRGGTLRVGAGEDAYRLTGPRGSIAQYPLNVNVFETLVRMTPNYEVVPLLATSWTFKAPNTWRIKLRRGVRFHNGKPFNAQAVKWTFDRISQYGGGTPGLGATSTVIVDPYTVDVTPKYENRRLIEQLVHPSYSIIAPDTTPETSSRPVGTGPFVFERYDRQQQIVVARNPNYWGSKALLDRIVFRFLPDPNARRLALQAGDVDLILDVPREAVRDLQARSFLVQRSQIGAYEAMYCKIGTTGGASILRGNPAIRKAIGYAIDRKALINGVFEGLAKDEQTMVPARLLGDRNAKAVRGYTFDRAKARKLLDDAGWRVGSDGIRAKGGQRLTLSLIDGFPNALVHGSVPDFVQEQLQRVGIEVKIVKMPDGPSYDDRLLTGDGDLWLEQGSQNDANPLFLPALLFWSVGLFGDVGYQGLFAPGGRYDTLIKAALAQSSLRKTKALTADALGKLIDQNAIVIPLAGIYRIAVMRKKVRAFEPHPSGLQVRYGQVWLA